MCASGFRIVQNENRRRLAQGAAVRIASIDELEVVAGNVRGARREGDPGRHGPVGVRHRLRFPGREARLSLRGDGRPAHGRPQVHSGRRGQGSGRGGARAAACRDARRRHLHSVGQSARSALSPGRRLLRTSLPVHPRDRRHRHRRQELHRVVHHPASGLPRQKSRVPFHRLIPDLRHDREESLPTIHAGGNRDPRDAEGDGGPRQGVRRRGNHLARPVTADEPAGGRSFRRRRI